MANWFHKLFGAKESSNENEQSTATENQPIINVQTADPLEETKEVEMEIETEEKDESFISENDDDLKEDEDEFDVEEGEVEMHEHHEDGACCGGENHGHEGCCGHDHDSEIKV